MGNSPSQTAEASLGEPDNFDLNAISDGSGGEDTEGSKKKGSAPNIDPRIRSKSLSSSATTLNPHPAGVSLPRKLRSSKKELAPLDDSGYPPTAEEHVQMRDPDETSSDGSSSNAISVAPSPHVQIPLSERIGGTKRKRGSSGFEEALIAKPRKRQREKSSPPTSVEPTDKQSRQFSPTATESAPQQSGLQALEHDATLMSRETALHPQKSPRFPLRPNVDEIQVPEAELAENGVGMDKPPLRRSRATTVANRTFPFVVKKAGASSRNLQAEAINTKSAPEQKHQAKDRQKRSDGKQSSDFHVSSPRSHAAFARHSQNAAAVDEERYLSESDEDSARDTPLSPSTSKPKIKHHSAAQKLNSVSKRPAPKITQSARTRSPVTSDGEVCDDADDAVPSKRREKRKCAECEEVFRSRKLLKEHEQETGHVVGSVRTGATGRFTDDEIRKLENYKAQFCRMYDITGLEFNDMMTDSCRRGTGHVWLHDFITKQEFLAQYFDVLPRRNRKSMARFRERNWQNATGNKNWTAEDDDQVVKLVKEMGPKWVEIGQALTRTQDAVQQRWKKYLQYRDTRKDGIWSPEENETLAKAVSGAKKRGGLSQDESTDKKIAWSIVSDALGGTRTPKQCADRWQSLRESETKPRARQRRKEHNPNSTATRRGKQLSSTYIDESDSEFEKIDRSVSQSESSQDEQGLGNGEAKAPGTGFNVENTMQESSKSFRPIDDDGFVSASQSRRQSRNGQSRNTRLASQDLQGEENADSKLRSPEVPAVPNRKTPSKVTTLSQAFANTQADTSALRRPHLHAPTPMSDRPSPRIPVELRLQSPVIEETLVDPHEVESANSQESVLIQEPSTFQSMATNTTQAGSNSVISPSSPESEDESESESDEDEEVFGVKREVRTPESGQSVSEDSESKNGSEASEEEADAGEDLQPVPVIPPRIESREVKKLLGEEETSSEGESDSEDDSSSDEETASASDNDDDSDDESEDSMVEDARSDFMESIKQTAKKAELAKKQKSVQVVQPAVEDSDSDSDAESIAHG